jgi:hypothetical protein
MDQPAGKRFVHLNAGDLFVLETTHVFLRGECLDRNATMKNEFRNWSDTASVLLALIMNVNN